LFVEGYRLNKYVDEPKRRSYLNGLPRFRLKPNRDRVIPKTLRTVKILIWRDCVGIEPTGDGTRLPSGFEVLGGMYFVVLSSAVRCYIIRFMWYRILRSINKFLEMGTKLGTSFVRKID